jgi:hypothetical protein
MSATFPYVSPAARMNLDLNGHSCVRTQMQAGYHLVDGGYYDNYGVGALLDWLQPVLTARYYGGSNKLNFTHVAIVQLRAFALEEVKKKGAGTAALFGPPLTLSKVFGTSARERDSIEVGRFLTNWNARFAASCDPKLRNVNLRTFVFENGRPSGPLSWQLSHADVTNVDWEWTTNKDLQTNLRDLKSYLETGKISP